MTSERAGDQVSHESADSTLVKATSALGGHDRPTEAPRQEFDDWWSVPYFAKHWPQQDIDVLKEFAWQRFQCGYFEALRDGA